MKLREYRKDPRFLIALPLLVIAITSTVYYLVQRAKELSPEALSSRLLLFVLWNINLVLILGILFVIFRGIIKLLIDRQKGLLGSRFRAKLVVTYVATSLVPIVILFFVATDLLRVSIDRWFNSPIETLLRNSREIAETMQNRALAEARAAAGEISATLRTGGDPDKVLRHVSQFHTVELVGMYDGAVPVRLVANPRSPVHELTDLPPSFFAEVERNGSSSKIDVVRDGKWLRYGVRPRDAGGTITAVAGVFLPNDISRKIDQSIIAHQHFEQLNSQKETFKASQTSLFLAVTLYILFGTLWISIFASRRITVPIAALAEGTRTLAEGRFDHRIGVRATDEFGTLIDSFNTMAAQLQTQREALTESNRELEQVNRRVQGERAHLSTVLESISTGIVAVGANGTLLSVNRAALRMLQIEEPAVGSGAAEAFDDELAPLAEYLRRVSDRDHRPREITLFRRGELKYFEVSASPLAIEGEERAWVVAIEDSTQLVHAQKLAAWSEAARRIAHEIKNPLTPIQLSAERIAKKHRAGDPDLGRALEEGCRTIVSEVSHLKQMVDEFSRFARLPAVHLRQSSIAEVIEQAAALYREVKPDVTIEVEADRTLQALIDPEQIRRALVNLLDNAVEATDRGVIRIAARRRNRSLLIEVSDPGRGVSDADKERLFLPYFSTKGRGTGLGLAIVHRIVHDHDGRISVHDNQPKGTRFEIELPA